MLIISLPEQRKLILFSHLLKRYIRDNPGQAMAAGIAAALAGAGLAIAVAPVIITTGTVITAGGEILVMFGAAVAGLGLVFGVVGKSSADIMKNIMLSGFFIAGTGAAVMLAGILVTGLGYAVMIGGGALAFAGLGIAGCALNRMLEEAPEDRAVMQGFETVVHDISVKQDISGMPVIIADLDRRD